MKKNNFILNAKDLASYICYRYFKIYAKGKKEISPIKLQKSLYFLFAYWGGFVRKNNNNIDYVEEKINQSEYLFEDEFHAWVYGPVIPKIFGMYKNNEIDYKELNEDEVFNGTDNFELFEIADFKLVSISHEDNCWKDHFDIFDNEHNEVIPRDEIVNEYALRETV